jgi:cyclase
MNRALIVARIQPGSHLAVARLFAESDRTALPRDVGVRERALYCLDDLYLHVVDFERDAGQAMATAQRHPGFGAISERLGEYITPYSPQWSEPRDAMARRFYRWRADR